MLCCLLIIGLTMYKRAVSEQQLSVERLTEQ
jgi:hypothetical protein